MRATVSRVRIPLPPPITFLFNQWHSNSLYWFRKKSFQVGIDLPFPRLVARTKIAYFSIVNWWNTLGFGIARRWDNYFAPSLLRWNVFDPFVMVLPATGSNTKAFIRPQTRLAFESPSSPPIGDPIPCKPCIADTCSFMSPQCGFTFRPPDVTVVPTQIGIV